MHQPKHCQTSRRSPSAKRQHRLVRCAAACLLGLSMLVQAAPDDKAVAQGRSGGLADDPIISLLTDRGLPRPLDASMAAVQSLHRTVRETTSELVMTAMNFLGVPYRRGGNDADKGFDCSGFTRHIFENSVGLVLPRRADEQAKDSNLLAVARQELKPGDLVFFNTMRRTFSHVGIYVGGDKFIHAPKPGGEVRVDDMRAAYWDRRFTGARRADLNAPAGTGPALR